MRIRSHYSGGVKTTQFIGAGYAQQGGYCNQGTPCTYAKPVVWLFGPVGGGTTAGLLSGSSSLAPLVLVIAAALYFIGF